jgi:hypothetical protein
MKGDIVSEFRSGRGELLARGMNASQELASIDLTLATD